MSRPASEHSLLELEMRRRLVSVVRQYPGLHIREAARQLSTSMALVEYHLNLLADSGLVRIEKDDRYARLYASGPRAPDAQEKALLAILRERLPLSVTLFLLDRAEPVKHGDIAQALSLGKSKLSFHLRKLEAAGVVRKTSEGAFEAIEAKRLHRLLADFPPTSELRSEFAKLWLSLYGER